MPLNKEYVSLSKKMTSSKKEFKGLLRKQYTKLATKDKIKKFIVDSVCDNPGISSCARDWFLLNTARAHAVGQAASLAWPRSSEKAKALSSRALLYSLGCTKFVKSKLYV